MKFSNVLLNNTSKHYVVRFVKLTASKVVPKCALCTHKYKQQMYKHKACFAVILAISCQNINLRNNLTKI